ncbi:hypothetical protein [Roseomonas xinghualingensis]|uniref:hypothetical protein n=1 Tax=Roseomonas xinghualingensis TaxID=2986475 RepID=UPI0021F20EDF|nr:hypothetical protein [Roseomonas sp. SXEYE001]MCV4208477.1 hypothetical protein [Roseomonas sp. SXEYE001]
MRAGSLLLAGMGALLALSACGRVGPIRPPGPPSEIIYPRLYPYFPPGTEQGAQATPPPATTRGEVPVERSNLPVVRPASPR